MDDIGEIEFFQPARLKENCPISIYESKYECRNGEFELLDLQNKCEGRFGILKCPKSIPYLCNGPSFANGERSVFCAQQTCFSLVPPESCPQQAVVDASNEMVLTLLPNFVSNLTLMDLNSTTH